MQSPIKDVSIIDAIVPISVDQLQVQQVNAPHEGPRARDPYFDPDSEYYSKSFFADKAELFDRFRRSHLIHNPEARLKESRYSYDYWGVRDYKEHKRPPLIVSYHIGEEYVRADVAWSSRVSPPHLRLVDGYYPRQHIPGGRGAYRDKIIGPHGGWWTDHDMRELCPPEECVYTTQDFDPDAILKTYIEDCDKSVDVQLMIHRGEDESAAAMDQEAIAAVQQDSVSNSQVIKPKVACRSEVEQHEEVYDSKLESLTEKWGRPRALQFLAENLLERAEPPRKAAKRPRPSMLDSISDSDSESHSEFDSDSGDSKSDIDPELELQEPEQCDTSESEVDGGDAIPGPRLSGSYGNAPVERSQRNATPAPAKRRKLTPTPTTTLAMVHATSVVPRCTVSNETTLTPASAVVEVATSTSTSTPPQAARVCYAGTGKQKNRGGCISDHDRHELDKWPTKKSDLAKFEAFVEKCCRLDKPMEFSLLCQAQKLQIAYAAFVKDRKWDKLKDAAMIIQQTHFGWCCEVRFCKSNPGNQKTYHGVSVC